MASKSSYTRLEFTKEEEEQIIDFVKQNPLLYDLRNPNYKNRTSRDKLWNDIATSLNKSGK